MSSSLLRNASISALLACLSTLAGGTSTARAEAGDNDPRRLVPPDHSAVVVTERGAPAGGFALAWPQRTAGYFPFAVTAQPPAGGAKRFRVSIPGTQAGGVVVASAYDSGVCAVESWSPARVGPSSFVEISVAYFPSASSPAPASCAISYTRVFERAGVPAPLAYGFFGFPTVPQQIATAAFGFNSAGANGNADAPKAVRLAPGRYRVEIPKMAAGDISGNVITTPYGAVDRICRPGVLARGAADALTFEVRCDETRSRAATDTAFTMLFTRGSNAAGSRSMFTSGRGGPEGLSYGAGGLPVSLARSTFTGVTPGTVALMSSTKDDSWCWPVYAPPPVPMTTVRCDGSGTGSYYFLATP
ncbi:MAG: hypothetical protein JST00_03730 [Deltaproteobacteria bacterium]|nr:hypothetical protein [Deltaproteobacteria bacterium]